MFTQLIDQITDNISVYFYPNSLVIDSYGNPHVSYTETREYVLTNPKAADEHSIFLATDLKYAESDGSQWGNQKIATNMTSDNDGMSRLVLDSKGQPHLCYIHENYTAHPDYGSFSVSRTPEYLYRSDGTWLNQTIEKYSSNCDYFHLTFRLDNDNPTVYFFRETYQPTQNLSLIRADWSETIWNQQYLGSLPLNSYGVAAISNVAFDAYGNPCFTHAEVVGTYRSAYRYGELTYTTISAEPLTSSPLFLPVVVGAGIVFVVMALAIAYTARRKKAGIIRPRTKGS
jgi:hypothetical protein